MDKRMFVTRKFAELYSSLRGCPDMEDIIDDAYDHYLNSENLPGKYEHDVYWNFFREMRLGGL